MATTEPIIISIEGDPSDLIADAKKVQSEMDALSAKLKEAGVSQTAYNRAVSNAKSAQKEATLATQQTTASVKQSSISITDLRSAYMIAADAARIAGQVWQATGGEFVAYAEQVKNMSRSLGASAEETSRLIQVADDVRVSYDTLKIAMKEAQKDGIDPNIEGLAKLADEYVKLQSPTQKTQFLLDKFGKSGLEMGKLMEKGGDGIRALSAAIDDNMIMTEEGIKASDQYQHSLDELNDSWSAIKITIGSYLVGPATDLLNHYRDINTSLKENGYWYTLLHQFSLDDIEAKRQEADAAFEASQGNEELTGSLEDNSGAMKDNKEAVKAAEQALSDYKDSLEEISRANQEAESFIQSYADFSKNYAEEHAAAVEQVKEAEQGLAEATQEYGAQSEQALSAAADVSDAQKGVQDLEASWHESTNKMIYDMTLAKVSVDGLTDAEFKATQDLAVQMGIRTQAQADEAKAAMDKATALAEGIALQEDVMSEKEDTDQRLLQLENDKAVAAGETTNTIIEGSGVAAGAMQQVTSETEKQISTQKELQGQLRETASLYDSLPSGGSSSHGSSGSSGSSSGGSSHRSNGRGGGTSRSRDIGGSGVAGEIYMIGTGAQPEAFIPNTSGTFVPNADKKLGGATYNIVINNPKPMPAESSIRNELLALSYREKV